MARYKKNRRISAVEYINYSLRVPVLYAEQIQCCYLVNFENQISTCFVLFYEGRSFFVGAKHALLNLKNGDNLHFSRNNQWEPLKITECIADDNGNDVTIFTSKIFSHQVGSVPINRAPMVPGSTVIYLGFPHGLAGTFPKQLDFPTPLAKVAYISGRVEVNGISIPILDGINNPGFSGGPIYCNNERGFPVVIGLISGYRYEKSSSGQLYRKLSEQYDEEKVAGHYVKLNSGIIYFTDITCAESLSHNLTTSNVVERVEQA